MRGAAAGLASPHPIGATLPGLYQEDDFAQRFCAALDAVLAPVIATLDALPAYLDPTTTPDDVLDWLTSWVGLAMAPALPLPRRRALVAGAFELHAWRGTATAVRRAVELATGQAPDVLDTGAVGWSQTPGTRFPPAGREVLVRVNAGSGPGDDLDAVAWQALHDLVALVMPAHVAWGLERVASPSGVGRATPDAPAQGGIDDVRA